MMKHLSSEYGHCRAELNDQHKKRDQSFLFFIAAEGLFAGSIISENTPTAAAVVISLVLFLVGLVLTFVIMRYKLHRDKMVICSVVMQKLLALDGEPSAPVINAELINKLGAQAASAHLLPRAKTKWKRFMNRLFSAETLVYIAMIVINFINILFLMFTAGFFSDGVSFGRVIVVVAVALVYFIALLALYFVVVGKQSRKCAEGETHLSDFWLLDILPPA